MTTVTYVKDHPYLRNPPGYAPQPNEHAWLEIVVHHQGGHRRIWAMVDTGADDLILDNGVAAKLGVPPGQPYPVATAGGTSSMRRIPKLTVDLAGTSIQTDVVFGVLSLPLLGRRVLLDAVEFGFGKQRWYHT